MRYNGSHSYRHPFSASGKHWVYSRLYSRGGENESSKAGGPGEPFRRSDEAHTYPLKACSEYAAQPKGPLRQLYHLPKVPEKVDGPADEWRLRH